MDLLHGWRRSEVLGLEWSRVDRKAGIVRLDVGTTKNKDGREFIYRDIAACELAGCPGRLMHDFQRTAVRTSSALVSRSVAMAITGHKTEAVYRRYAIVSSGDLADAARKLHAMTGTITATIAVISDNAESAKASA